MCFCDRGERQDVQERYDTNHSRELSLNVIGSRPIARPARRRWAKGRQKSRAARRGANTGPAADRQDVSRKNNPGRVICRRRERISIQSRKRAASARRDRYRSSRIKSRCVPARFRLPKILSRSCNRRQVSSRRPIDTKRISLFFSRVISNKIKEPVAPAGKPAARRHCVTNRS